MNDLFINEVITKNKFINYINKIDGLISDIEAELLFSLAKKCKNKGVIVEIGSWKGKSTVCLALGSKKGSKNKIYAVDPHIIEGFNSTYNEFITNIKKAKVEDVVIPLVKTSKEASKNFKEKIELIFIDGDHSYQGVREDFELWFPKVIDGGIVVFHDTIGHKGPKKLVEKALYKSRFFKNVQFVGSISFGQKVKKNSIIDKIRNRYVLLLKELYEQTGNLCVKLKVPKSIYLIGRKIVKIFQ
ncbi:class I SAM-dependent methyltransferase [Candidatus Woesearchaeota archaeon]|nr:class I SAM-dependent methyltransferase [Candidatus Woesearchaeota archaeon]